MRTRLGGWLFRHRGLAPVPLLVAELIWGQPGWGPWALGWAPLLAGLGLRAWGVGHLGARSRTRDGDTWELIRAGPFGAVRNPLYLGNGLMWLGVGLCCGPLWAAGWGVFLVLHYTLVVGWEEENLRSELGAPYARYLAEVPRWWPRGRPGAGGDWSAAEVLRGERSTWLATAAVMGALALRI